MARMRRGPWARTREEKALEEENGRSLGLRFRRIVVEGNEVEGFGDDGAA